jgi:glycosyltransferase involved in cell wall biosynthesis
MKFTFIIGYRHKKDRLDNLKKTLEWMYSFNNCEIIIVEQDIHSKIKEFNFLVKHIFVKSNQPYNRSWAFNIGTRYANTDILVFTDSDLIIDKENLLKSFDSLSEYDVISPYDKVIDLTKSESNLNIDNIFKINKEGRGELDNQKINLCGGMVIFKKSAINQIGGWSERFMSWGGEDDYQSLKVNTFLKSKELNGVCYHLYHQKQKIDSELYSNNLQLLAKLKEYTKQDLTNEILKTTKIYGRKNKYC